MERLPDRNIEEEKRIAARKAKESDGEKKTGAEKLRANFATYGVLVLLVCVLFFIMADEAVPFEDIHINEIRTLEDNEGILIVGELSDTAGRYCKSQVNFNEESGTVEVSIRQYQVSTILGTKEFIVPVEEAADEIKSVWLVYDDGANPVQRKQIYGPESGTENSESEKSEE